MRAPQARAAIPRAWPRITVVTPSYNQAAFLEQTISSVILQRYPNLEYFVMDGGSSDGSAAMIERYADHLDYWQSRPDGGQADAISTAFGRASGDVLGWINSDDYYLPGALIRVGAYFAENPNVQLVVCGGIAVDSAGRLLRKQYAFPQDFSSLLAGGQFFMQMSSFWRREAYELTGGLDPSLRFCFDYDLFLRLTRSHTPHPLEIMAAAFRLHDRSKTTTIWKSVALPERDAVRRRYGFDALDTRQRERLASATVADFYRVTRRGILRDAYRDPRYFGRCILNKVLGRPGSRLIGGPGPT